MLINKYLFCKGVKAGWRKCIQIDPSTMPERCVAIEIEEEGERFVCVHHMTQHEASKAYIKVVFKKLRISGSQSEIWEEVSSKTEIYDPYIYDKKIKDVLSESGLRSLMVKLFVS